MQEKLDHIRYEQAESLKSAALHFFKFVCLEAEARNIETSYIRDCSPPVMETVFFVLEQLFLEFGSAMKDARTEMSTTAAPVSLPENTATGANEFSALSSTPPEGTMNPEISLPEEDSPEHRLEKHFGPARPPIITAMGYILDFNHEGCIRFVGPGNRFGTIPCSKSEYETALALIEANGRGLTNVDLSLRVTRWRDTIPKAETVQRMVSRLTDRFENAGVPLRGRTENVNLSGGLIAGQNLSKKRSRGRPRKPGDGQFRAFLFEISPSISTC